MTEGTRDLGDDAALVELLVADPPEAWTAAGLENPAGVAGNANTDQGGNDVLFDARWYAGTNVLGTSTLFKLLQPGRTPVVGVDSGGTLTYAAFWTVAVPNDGVASVTR